LSSPQLDPLDKIMVVLSYLWAVELRGFFVSKQCYANTSMSLTVSIALAVSAFLTSSFESNDARIIIQPFSQAQTVEEYVRDYFADVPVMAEVAKCESRFRQYDKSGNVLRGEQVYEDVGVMQVNETYHKKASVELGLDISTIQGNVAYARYLYEKEGTKPWNSSKKCWSKTQVAKDHLAAAN